MEFNSDLLTRFASALQGAVLDGTEEALRLPSQLNAVITIPSPLVRYAGFSETAARRDSFLQGHFLAQPASAAAVDTTIATLSRGLWKVHLWKSVLANFTQVSDGSVFAASRIMLVDAVGGASEQILAAYAVNGVPQAPERVMTILLGEDNWNLVLSFIATGVAQTFAAATSVYYSRLH